MIYIFGELHDDKTDCHIFPQEKSIDGKKVPIKSMFIEDYMKQLLMNADSYIDFFLEEKAHTGYDPDLTPYKLPDRINILRDSFRECISDVKSRNKNINCRVSRSHYFDIRTGSAHINVVTELFLKLDKLLEPRNEIIKKNIQALES